MIAFETANRAILEVPADLRRSVHHRRATRQRHPLQPYLVTVRLHVSQKPVEAMPLDARVGERELPGYRRFVERSGNGPVEPRASVGH